MLSGTVFHQELEALDLIIWKNNSQCSDKNKVSVINHFQTRYMYPGRTCSRGSGFLWQLIPEPLNLLQCPAVARGSVPSRGLPSTDSCSALHPPPTCLQDKVCFINLQEAECIDKPHYFAHLCFEELSRISNVGRCCESL